MEDSKATKLLLRQLKDIQAQAEKIGQGNDSQHDIETFARYSIELKEYILKNVKSEEVVNYLNELPDVQYDRLEVKLWQYFIMPSWWISLYNDYMARKKAVEEITIVKGKYATLELLIRANVD